MRPLEGVVHALRNIHAALASDGIVSSTPNPCRLGRRLRPTAPKLGTLDMRDWLDTIHAVG